MNTNKFDNLFGSDRDWIEGTLRDYEVPDGAIMEIGAHFFVLQNKINKLEAEKANKRDIFAEIGRAACQREEEAKQMIPSLIKRLGAVPQDRKSVV